MQELSMNILDVAENSVRAGASLIEIVVQQDVKLNKQTVVVKDNGKGMSATMARQVVDPFCTTRTTRKVGLGLPFLKMAAEMTGGDMAINSTLGIGTTITATFTLDHIDLMPLGDMASTITVLVQTNPDIVFCYTYQRGKKQFVFSTSEVREILGDIPLSEPAVALFIREYLTEHVNAVATSEEPIFQPENNI